MVNLSIFAIPAYWLITLLPHSYGIGIMKKANNGVWNNASPRSTVWDEKLRKSIPADIYGRYERAEAAHKNGFENMSLFLGAIFAGNVAKLDHSLLNTFAGVYLAMRVIYTLLYINTTKNKSSFARTGIWMLSTFGCMAVFIKSGIELM